LRSLALAIASSWVTVGITLLVAWAGYVSYRAATIYGALVAAFCAAFFAAIRSGFNRRFADPNLTVAQLVAVGLAVSYVAYEGGAARPTFLAMYLVAYMFGVLSLNRRGLISMALFYVACYAGVIGLSFLMRPSTVDIPREAYRILVFAILLAWMSYLGSYVSELRQHLRRTAAELKQALERMEDLATHDGLTGCLNRRRMLELLNLECERAKRGSAFSVCLLDIDHFKSINDRHGHQAGDEVLVQFVAVVQRQLRVLDSLTRYGGEEFLIVCPQTTLASAAVIGERVRHAVEAERFSALPPGQRLTVSVGVAGHDPSDGFARTLARVDAALFEAKNSGRNRLACAE
jgi:diguanylate cyclase